MMKRLTYCAVLLLAVPAMAAELSSPSGKIKVTVSVADGAASYSVTRDGKAVLEKSPLGLIGKDFDLSKNVKLLGEKTDSIKESFEMLTGKALKINADCNRLVVSLASGERNYDVEFRAYDDGVAFAYFLKGCGEIVITSEATGFALPKGAKGWLQPRYSRRSMSVSNEGMWQAVDRGAQAIDYPHKNHKATGWCYPSMFKVGDTYALISESGVTRNYCATYLSDCDADGLYRVAFPLATECKGLGDAFATATLPFRSPWRVIMIGDLKDVVTSNLVFKVADPLSEKCKGKFPAWIKPGKSAWSWWSGGTGGPSTAIRYIDGAAALGWDYILIDARWDRWKPDAYEELRKLVDYGKTKKIGILIWYNSGGKHTWASPGVTPVNFMHERDVRRKEMAKLQEIGIAGLKVDFFDGDKQDRMKQYIGILDDALDFELLINFHGCTVPRGWARRFPNLMTMEAIRGAEAFGKGAGPEKRPPAIHNVHAAMIRNVIGSMDFTPVMFHGRCVSDHPESRDYSFELATAIAFESGITHYPDSVGSKNKGYDKVVAKYPEVGTLLREIPTAWDETRLLSGDLDSHCVFARRKGDRWYVGGLNGKTKESQALTLACSFLGEGKYDMVRIESAGKREMKITKSVTSATDTIKAELPVGGGISIMLTPKK